MLVEFTKPISGDDPQDLVEKRLNQTLLQIGEKEEVENEILKATLCGFKEVKLILDQEYYDSQIQYNLLLQEWREKVISIEENCRKKLSVSGMGKFPLLVPSSFHDLDYQTTSKLIGWDEAEQPSPDWIGIVLTQILLPSSQLVGQRILYSDLKYEDSNFLGSGAFGSVFKGTVHHSPCAIKVLNSTWNNQARESFLGEISTLR